MKRTLLIYLFLLQTLSAQTLIEKGQKLLDFNPEKMTFAQRPAAIRTALDSVEIRDRILNGLLYKMTYDYDANGNTTMYVYYEYSFGSISAGEKKEITYDALNRPTVSVLYLYGSGTWNEDSRTRTFYNGTSEMIDSMYVDAYNAGNWEDYLKYYYTYQNNTLQEKTQYYFNGTGWETQKRYVYTYDANGNVTEELVYRMENGQWVYDSKATFAYNAQDYRTEEIYYIHNNGQWEYDDKTLYFFNAWNDMVYSEDYTYNTSSQSWENEIKLNFTHDGNVPYSDLLIPFDDGKGQNGLFTHKAVSATVHQGSNWDYVANLTFFYSDRNVNVSIEEDAALAFNLYPNPATDFIILNSAGKIKPESIEIHSLTGQLVKRFEADIPERIRISDLTPGIYLISIYSDNRQFTLKFQKAE